VDACRRHVERTPDNWRTTDDRTIPETIPPGGAQFSMALRTLAKVA
jgi:hypothetical protein